MTEPTYTDYVELRKSDDPPPPAPQEDSTRFYADEDGALRSMQSDGTDAPVAGAGVLPNPTNEGDVLTVVDGEWAGAAGGGSQPVTVRITSDQILALHETPVVIAAGRPGFVIQLQDYFGVYKAGPTPYSGFGPTANVQFVLRIATGIYDIPTGLAGMPGVFDQATDQLFAQGYGYSLDNPLGEEGGSFDGADLMLNNQDTDPTDGDGTVVLTLNYYYAPLS